MSYLQGSLNENETIIYQSKLHWVIFLVPGLFASVFALMGLSGFAVLAADIKHEGMDPLASVAVNFGIALLILAPAIVKYVTSEFGITNRRIVVKSGFIRRRSLELQIGKVESLQVDQGVMGRILGFGTVDIAGAGTSKNSFKGVRNPMELRQQLYAELEKGTTRGAA